MTFALRDSRVQRRGHVQQRWCMCVGSSAEEEERREPMLFSCSRWWYSTRGSVQRSPFSRLPHLAALPTLRCIPLQLFVRARAVTSYACLPASFLIRRRRAAAAARWFSPLWLSCTPATLYFTRWEICTLPLLLFHHFLLFVLLSLASPPLPNRL